MNERMRAARAGRVPHVDAQVFGFSGRFGDARPMAALHQHQEVELNYLLDGEAVYWMNGRRVVLRSRRLAAFWGVVPHRLVSGPSSAAFFYFTLPPAWLWRLGLPPRLLEALLGGALIVDPQERAVDEPLCRQWAADLGTGPGAEAAGVAADVTLSEIGSRLRRLAAAWQPPGPRALRAPAASPPASPALRMMRFIAERYAEDIAVADVAAAAGLHPNYAMSLFRREVGETINAAVTRHRVFHAQRLLIGGDSDLLGVGLDSGFGSASRFYAAFRRVTGTTPAAYRAAAAAAAATSAGIT